MTGKCKIRGACNPRIRNKKKEEKNEKEIIET